MYKSYKKVTIKGLDDEEKLWLDVDMVDLKEKSENLEKFWIQRGVDIWMLKDNLKLSFEERIRQHQDTLNFIDKLIQARKQQSAKS